MTYLQKYKWLLNHGWFSSNRPTGPIRSSSRDVRMYVCMYVCPLPMRFFSVELIHAQSPSWIVDRGSWSPSATRPSYAWSLKNGGWVPMRSLETDHVISGPMRGLKINIWDGTNKHTHIHTDIATLWLTRPRGPIRWNSKSKKYEWEKNLETFSYI